MKQPAAIITGTMASPSSPSVRLTAFDEPTITSIAKGKKNSPKSSSRSLKNGTATWVDSGSRVIQTIHAVATKAIANWKTSFQRPARPLEFFFVSFR
jgi:hypothetical protein